MVEVIYSTKSGKSKVIQVKHLYELSTSKTVIQKFFFKISHPQQGDPNPFQGPSLYHSTLLMVADFKG
jgi:hypothetical protein